VYIFSVQLSSVIDGLCQYYQILMNTNLKSIPPIHQSMLDMWAYMLLYGDKMVLYAAICKVYGDIWR
jgi:hypothetical protein